VLLRWSTPDGEEDLAGPCDPVKLRDILVNVNFMAADPLVEPSQDTQDENAPGSGDGASDTDSDSDETALLDLSWTGPEN
jgi:hypothetical protein